MRRRSWRRPVAAATGLCALAAAAAFWLCLPDPLFTEPLSSVLVARDGDLLGARIASDGQWRLPPMATVPEKFSTALIAYEDKRFARHPGVDPLAVLRAVRLNVKAGRIVSGGSTITMQVIRLARNNGHRTYLEKAIEAIWALRLEMRATKAEILALYAAHAPFGGNVVGLEAAAWRYFGRSPHDLSWAEASMLAVLPNSPAMVHPGRNRNQLELKRNTLLRRLHDRGEISDIELQLSLLEPLPAEPRPLPQDAPHLLETLTSRDRAGGRRYPSTIDAALQRAVQGIVTRHSQMLGLRGIDNAAALVIDNRRFEVIAYAGNSQWSVTNTEGYAIDLIHRPRSTGSILKPLLFAHMLDAGEILPPTLVPDLPTQYDGYMPENYDGNFRGAVPARLALARSLNIPAVRMLRDHGVARFYDFLRNMGMSTLHRPPDSYGLTLILGGAEGTLWDITGMYANVASIAQNGRYDVAATYRVPRILRDAPTGAGRPADLSTGAAWLTLDALVEVTRPGADGFWQNFTTSQKIAWKTGTSFGLRDAWAVGSTAKYTVGVWAGNATGEGRPQLTGVSAAAPVMFDIFNRLDAADWFPRPAYALKSLEVCADDGYLANGGCDTDTTWAPRNSHFERVSPHHRWVHLDQSGAWRVHGRCESTSDMTHESWFVLPAGQEFYYRKHHTAYRRLPPYRPDCVRYGINTEDDAGPIEFLYPNTGTRLYIPVDLAGRRGRAVFQVAHRNPDATLFWHLDGRFIGTTTTFHEQALDVPEGAHTLTVVDEQGNLLKRDFEVLGKGSEP